MKPCISLLLVFTMLLVSLTGCQGHAESSTSSEQESPASDFEYKENESGITITNYLGDDTNVIIPNTIDGKTVTKLGDSAFAGNTSIVSVKVPSDVFFIDGPVFKGCAALTTVKLPHGLRAVGPASFEDCTSLSEITLPDTLECIYDSAFANCLSLKTICIPATITDWGSHAFACSGLETVIFAEGLTFIGFMAFWESKLREIVLPSSVQYIDYGAFANCQNLESVTLNEGLIEIEYVAFGYPSKLVEIVIPDTVTYISELTFSGCNTLEKVLFEGNAPEQYGSSIPAQDVHYTVYYHEGAEGFTSPEWNGYKTAIW